MTINVDDKLFKRLNAVKFNQQKTLVFGRKGISPNELDQIEEQLALKLPPDFRCLLENLHDPLEVFFPWNKFTLAEYQESIEWIISGIEFDIEHNSCWLSRWGTRPEDLTEAKMVMREDFKGWPRLVPIKGHRYLAVEPCLAGNPVFSIWQTDIICYGATLGEYLINEFVEQIPNPAAWTPKRDIPIWQNL